MTKTLAQWLRFERDNRIDHSVYYWTSILLAYNSNHIEGSTLSEDQTRQIFDTGSFFADPDAERPVRTDDVIETRNHFRAFSYILDVSEQSLTHEIIKSTHKLLKEGTSQDLHKEWNVGGYKLRDNQIGMFDPIRTTPANRVEVEMSELIELFSQFSGTDGEFAQLHERFERIHPFSDGNGRVGRLILFKEALRINALPAVIFDEDKLTYTEALRKYPVDASILVKFMHSSREKYAEILARFGNDGEKEDFSYSFSKISNSAKIETKPFSGKVFG